MGMTMYLWFDFLLKSWFLVTYVCVCMVFKIYNVDEM